MSPAPPAEGTATVLTTDLTPFGDETKPELENRPNSATLPPMNKMMKTTIALMFLTLLSAGRCAREERPPSLRPTLRPVLTGDAYLKSVEKWRTDRMHRLTGEDGWVTLTGLFWLHEGPNRVGSDPKNEIILPAGKTPAHAGAITLKGGKMHFEAGRAAAVTSNGKPAQSLDLSSDQNGAPPTTLRIGPVSFYAIKRGDKLGIRVKDSESELRKHFPGIEHYAVDPKWRIEAHLERANPPKKIQITNIIGQSDEEPSPGTLVFSVGGRELRLDPVLEEGELNYFVIFADQTTGKETYPSGRFLYVVPADAQGKVIIDFNEAYNPPCAFSKFATCPLPPAQNRLPIAVTAGEKKFGHNEEELTSK
jgi:uncharacterized protein (DUF1684 family)